MTTPFNRMPFNRQSVIEAYFNVSIASLAAVGTRLSVDMPVTIKYESATQTDATFLRDVGVEAAISAATEILTSFLREYALPGITFETAAQLAANVSYSRVESAKYSGNFAPGDRIVIDTKAQTITINGINALDKLTGEFISLVLGDNVMTYTDDESVRNILTRVTHRDKYLY